MNEPTNIYAQLIRLMIHAKRQMFLICESRKLTPVQGMVLITMEPDSSRTMQELADMMGCDASNITGLIDRLEVNELIIRTADKKDRRVKKIQLTDHGIECRQAILDELVEAEAIDIKQLDDDEVEALQKALNKLV